MAVEMMPVPRGLVSTSASPGRAPALSTILSGCTTPVTDMPYLGSRSFQLTRLSSLAQPEADVESTPTGLVISYLISDMAGSVPMIFLQGSHTGKYKALPLPAGGQRGG